MIKIRMSIQTQEPRSKVCGKGEEPPCSLQAPISQFSVTWKLPEPCAYGLFMETSSLQE